jgi:hypothetical protein
LMCRRFLVSCSPTCQSFLLVAKPFELYVGNHCLCLLVPVYSLLYPALDSKSLLTLSWYLYRVKDMHPVSVFCLQLSSFPSNICWWGCLFAIICSGLLCQK